jgi:hypothetical protein
LDGLARAGVGPSKGFFILEETVEKKEKRMSHIRNLVSAIEDKGYLIGAIKWINNASQIEIVVDQPAVMGNRLFLEKARDETGAEG